MNKKVLLSAFACDPLKGSEASNGWNWAVSLANLGYQVTCLTRKINKVSIESNVESLKIKFVYVDLGKMEKAYSFSTATMYLYYLLWQKKSLRIAKELQAQSSFDIIHHVTWGSIQLGSYLYKLNVPFIFGPVGGGQNAPKLFKQYFGKNWNTERKRTLFSTLLEHFNPGFKGSVKRSKVLLVANSDTYNLASKYRTDAVFKTFDFALPKAFFPESIQQVKSIQHEFRLLWVGRFMPRKGIFIVLETMKRLKEQRNITLTIVGSGQLEQEIKNYIADNDLQATISLVGKVDYNKIGSYYQSHDAFFFTSLRDSCPIQLLEAMAFGLPIITLDLHGQSEIVSNNTGIKVQLINPESTINNLVDEILNLKKNESRFNEMRHSAYNFAKQLNWEAKVENISALYY